MARSDSALPTLIRAPPLATEVSHGRARPVHLTPVVDVHLPPHVFDREVHDSAVHRHRRVVDPCVDAPELPDRGVGDGVNLRRIRDVGDGVHGAAARPANGFRRVMQVLLVACGEHDTRATLSRVFRGHQPDAARSAGDHHDLFVEGLEREPHMHLSKFDRRRVEPSPQLQCRTLSNNAAQAINDAGRQ